MRNGKAKFKGNRRKEKTKNKEKSIITLKLPNENISPPQSSK